MRRRCAEIDDARGLKRETSDVMRVKLLAIVSAAALVFAGSAQAKVYQLNFTSGIDSGIVDFTTAGPWTGSGVGITGVSGQIDGSAVTGLSGYAGADNLLYDTAPHVDLGGVSVSTAVDTFNFTNYGSFQLLKASVDPTGSNADDLVPIRGSFVAVPEPATWTMLIMGVAAVGFAARRRKAGAALAA
jgi:hypothetical protein